MRTALPLLAIIVAGVVYHLVQKHAAGGSPWPLLVIAYSIALAATLVLAIASPSGAAWPDRGVWLSGTLLGLAVFGVEAGFFFVYRAGWPLASASVIASISVTAILLLIAMIVFREHVTAARVAGLGMAMGATILIARPS